jgi:signal transduction histidine kinase
MRGGSFPKELHLKYAILALSFACSGVSLLFILSPIPAPVIQQYWRADSIALICVLAGLSIGAFFSRRPMLTVALLAIRMAAVTIVCRPYGGLMMIKLPLWSGVFIEAGGFLDPPFSLLVQAFFSLVILLSQGPLLIWGEELIPGTPSVALVAAAVCLAGLAALLFLLRICVRVVRRNEEQSARLDEAVRQLTVANLSFQKLASSAEERSADDERKRITREIHDSIGYALNNLIMMMEAATRMAPKDAATLRGLLAQAREEAQVGLNETRKALRLLRMVTQDQVRGLSAIHRLVSIFSSATGVEVKVEYCNADQSFGDAIDLAVYRMIQEGMTNAFRHGRATLIRLQFWQDHTGVRVILWDNGTAEESVKDGIGLSGMRERVERIDGTFHASRVADGFEISAWLPFAGGLPPARSASQRIGTNEQNLPASG